MSKLDYDKLDAVAAAADSGKPWVLNESSWCHDASVDDGNGETVAAFTQVFPECAIGLNDIEANHIATFDPPTVRALIARARHADRLAASNAELHSLLDQCDLGPER